MKRLYPHLPGCATTVFMLGLTLPLLAGPPLKLSVRSARVSITNGESVEVTAELLDAANRPTSATKDLEVELITKSPSGKETKGSVKISAGRTSGTLSITPPDAGLNAIQATERELLEGGAYVHVRPRPVEKLLSAPKPIAIPAPAPPPAAAATPHHVPSSALAFEADNLVSAAPTARPAPPPPSILVRYQPHRTLLADGQDAASILGYADVAPASDLTVRLVPTDGRLNPVNLVIPKGELSGNASLTSSHAGTVDVEVLKGAYQLDLDGLPKLSIPFGPPIHALAASYPSSLSLVDSADLVVNLRDQGGTAVATDAPRHVTTAVTSGSIDVSPGEADIVAGSATARFRLTPVSLRPVVLVISTPGLADTTATIHVALPLLLVILTIVGGVAGGWVAATEGHLPLWSRIAIGILTGFVLYWGVLYVGLEKLPHAATLNPFTALVVAAVGGYGGTSVLNTILKRFGVAKARSDGGE